jgi:hypothetical protein
MEAIKKLKITSILLIFLTIAFFFYILLRVNPSYAIALIIVTLLFNLIRIFVFKKKNYFGFYKEDPYLIPSSYAIGAIFILMAIMASFGTIKDIISGAPIRLFLAIPIILFIFGFLLIYYSYKTKKESVIVNKKVTKEKKEPINKINEDKNKNYWIYELAAFIVVLSIIRYIFRPSQFTLGNVIATILSIIIIIPLIYFYFKTISSRKPVNPKKKKDITLLLILICLLIFSLIFTFGLLISSSKNDSGRCISKDLYPVNGIPGLQYCEKDSDCIKVTDRFFCCDSCHGGESNSINKKHVEFWECLRLQNTRTECSNALCSYNVTSQACFANAVCVNNICELDY